MIRAPLLSLAMLSLAACSDNTSTPPPVVMTAEAVGYYCQMHLLEHPGPKAQAHLVGLAQPLFFSQVRDGVAYQRMPEQSHAVSIVYVSDMGAPGTTWEEPGAENWIAATDAHYVVGSDVAGGMGASELVPFARRDAAEAFATRHGGQIMTLAEIPDAAVLAPVETDGVASEDEADFQRRLEALESRGEYRP